MFNQSRPPSLPPCNGGFQSSHTTILRVLEKNRKRTRDRKSKGLEENEGNNRRKRGENKKNQRRTRRELAENQTSTRKDRKTERQRCMLIDQIYLGRIKRRGKVNVRIVKIKIELNPGLSSHITQSWMQKQPSSIINSNQINSFLV